jgi:hypothetical protein
MIQNLSSWNDSVSLRAQRLGYPLEHFHGYSLVCVACDSGFRCFREFEQRCGPCRSRLEQ